jgi:hypothetical protein
MLGRISVSLVVCLAATIARAEGPPDILELRDGTFLQGRLTEWKPGSRAIIVLLNGESRTIHWSEITHASGPSLEQIRDARGRSSEEVDIDVDTTVIIPPQPSDPPHVEELPTEAAPPCLDPPPSLVVPPPSLVVPPKSSFSLMDPRRRKGFLLVVMSIGPLIAGAVYTGVGTWENGRGMQPLRDTYRGLGSTLLIGATASLVGGIVLLSTHKRDDASRPVAALRLSPGGMTLAGNF